MALIGPEKAALVMTGAQQTENLLTSTRRLMDEALEVSLKQDPEGTAKFVVEQLHDLLPGMLDKMKDKPAHRGTFSGPGGNA